MSIDRNVRCLSALNDASSNRVLNLAAIGQTQQGNDDYKSKPLLQSRVLNNSIILKHRLRADEAELFPTGRALATKIIIPFDTTNLKAGGRSMFIGQRGFKQLLLEEGRYREEADMRRDLGVLRVLDRTPSLDPFLLREQLKTEGVDVDPSYFGISSADQQKMFEYTAIEIKRLTALASAKRPGKQDDATARMVSALLSNEVNERLEPLRTTLGMDPNAFREGVFSWRGFIYYKWTLNEFWPNLIKCLREVRAITPIGKVDPELNRFFDESKTRILQGAKFNSDRVRKILAVYDTAYANLIEHHDPGQFRKFLLTAPELFLEIGEKMGSMTHLTSFWQYRFPAGSPKSTEAAELMGIFEDFTRNFSRDALAA
jgi:hypothetical protein